MTKTLLAVDGNSLTHRSYHALAGSGLRDSSGRPTWAIKGFFNQLLGAVDRVGADAIVIGFDDPNGSARKEKLPQYKAQRGEKDEELRFQLAAIPQLLADAGLCVVVPSDLEADDVTATCAQAAAAAGWRSVIMTSDRDAFAHISATNAVLRVINGGVDASPILTPDRFRTMSGISPEQYLDYAALRGDTSDNLPGVRGVGEKTAAKLLSGLGTMERVWEDLAAGGEQIIAAAGKAARTKLLADGARHAWARNRDIMAAVPVDLGFDFTGGVGHVPVQPQPLKDALNSYDLASVVGPALRALSAPAPAPAEEWLPPLESLVEPPAMDYPDAPDYGNDYGNDYPADPYTQPAQPAPASSGALHPAAAVGEF